MRGLWRLRIVHERWQAVLRRRAAERAVADFPCVAAKARHGLPFPVVVSVTSYPPRFPTLGATLKSLLDQDVQPDRVILWLTSDDHALLPAEVSRLTDHGLEIHICDNYLSFKKLVPSLQKFPDAGIVTADDDLYFRPEWLGSILGAYDHAAPAIVSTRAHLARLDNGGRLLPYASWVLDTHETLDVSDTELLFPTGGAGTLYPPHILPDEVCDASVFLKVCPRADDLWFFWHAEQRGVPHLRTTERFPLIWWRGSQDAGLYHENLDQGGNDQQIVNLEAALGLLRDPIRNQHSTRN